jgi:hypothetical protein
MLPSLGINIGIRLKGLHAGVDLAYVLPGGHPQDCNTDGTSRQLFAER